MFSSRRFKITLFCAALSFAAFVALEPAAVVLARPTTDGSTLNELANRFQRRLQSQRGPAYHRLLESTNPAQAALNQNPDIRLIFVDAKGRPFFYETHNLTAAKTVRTDKVWPGGGHGYSLTGSGTASGKLGIWDGGGVLTTHQELVGRTTQIDSPGGVSYHSTHVAGTMIAGGVIATAKGMSYQANLVAYEWNNDNAEMAAAAASGMNVSNHSYGYATGWEYSGDWYWYGDPDVSTVEDYYFGFYSFAAADWDEIAHGAPYYTIVASAGNSREDYGPGPGGGHWVWDNAAGDWVWSTATRDADGGTDGYDSISHGATAKNVISVGAVYDIPAGYSQPSDVVMTTFSSWGPADDGRIKPDLVANGTGLYSCSSISNSQYISLWGTSMAAPNLSGSLNSVLRHYESTHSGATPLSSTMKAVLLQTADEAGTSTGPDYKFGWGLLNTLKAAQLISLDSTEPFHIREDFLADGGSDTLYCTSDGSTPLRLTVAWTDPAGTEPPPALNPTTPALVNDLDLRLKYLDTPATYYPYVLNPGSPGGAATTGDNVRDNAEQVYVASPPAGDYMVVVSHKGTLAAGQWYSLVCSGKLMTALPDEDPPDVTVVEPNGAEVLHSGEQFEIRWVATDNETVESVSILLSRDGGLTFPDTVAVGEPNDSSYVWLVPGTYSTQCVIRVVAFDGVGNEGQDESDATFSIVAQVPALGGCGEAALALMAALTAALLLLRERRGAGGAERGGTDSGPGP